MLKLLDKTYFRFANAWAVFRDPDLLTTEFHEGLGLGVEVGQAQIKRALDMHDPHDFTNEHFKLGYYYAHETVKKVMGIDEDNPVA